MNDWTTIAVHRWWTRQNHTNIQASRLPSTKQMYSTELSGILGNERTSPLVLTLNSILCIDCVERREHTTTNYPILADLFDLTPHMHTIHTYYGCTYCHGLRSLRHIICISCARAAPYSHEAIKQSKNG